MVVSAIEMYAVVRSYILFAQLRFFTVIFPLTIIVEYTFTMAHLSNTSDPSHCNRYITVVTFPIWFFSLFSFLSYRIFSPVCVCLNFVCVFFSCCDKRKLSFHLLQLVFADQKRILQIANKYICILNTISDTCYRYHSSIYHPHWTIKLVDFVYGIHHSGCQMHSHLEISLIVDIEW